MATKGSPATAISTSSAPEFPVVEGEGQSTIRDKHLLGQTFQGTHREAILGFDCPDVSAEDGWRVDSSGNLGDEHRFGDSRTRYEYQQRCVSHPQSSREG
jgi:hypothetical protein